MKKNPALRSERKGIFFSCRSLTKSRGQLVWEQAVGMVPRQKWPALGRPAEATGRDGRTAPQICTNRSRPSPQASPGQAHHPRVPGRPRTFLGLCEAGRERRVHSRATPGPGPCSPTPLTMQLYSLAVHLLTFRQQDCGAGEARLSGGCTTWAPHPDGPSSSHAPWSPRPPRGAAVPGLVGPAHLELERAETCGERLASPWRLRW